MRAAALLLLCTACQRAAPPGAASAAPTVPPVVPSESAAPSTVPQPGAAPPDSPAPCGTEAARAEIAATLYPREDFVGYVCDPSACTKEEFTALLTYQEREVRSSPRASACFVTPAHPPTTSASGVFLLGGRAPRLLLVFVGVDIAPGAATGEDGYRDLVGGERLYANPPTWVDHRYVWKGGNYVHASATKRTGN